LARNLGHCEEDEEEEEPPGAGPARQTFIDADSQRIGLTLLRFLRSGSAPESPKEDAWKGFMLAVSASGDLLTALTHAITNTLADDLNILSMQGVESVYREFLEVKRWKRDGPGVKTMITMLVSEGLLAKVLKKTLLYNQEEGPNNDTSTADLLLTLSLKAHTKDIRVRVEMSRAIDILSGGWTRQIHDLLTDWLQEAMFRFPWLWPTLRRAKVIPLLMARVKSACHMLQDKSSDLLHALHAIQILCLLSQEYSYGYDILSTRPHTLLTIANNARLMQMARTDRENHIRRLSQDILSHRFLQTMLALKLLPDEYIPDRQGSRYSTVLHTLHHLILIESYLTTQQKEEAWLLLGQDEIPDLYAHLICAQLYDTDRSASLVMAAVLEGHTQAVSRISRDETANDETIYLSLSLLDIMCPRGWIRDREATEERWIHELTGAGQWDFPNLMIFEVTTMQGQPLQPSRMDDWSSRVIKSWAPINCTMDTLLHILLQLHPLGSLTEFRNNSMVALQQHSPQGTTLTPHFFNRGDTEGEKKSRKISHLINRATGLQTSRIPKHSRHY